MWVDKGEDSQFHGTVLGSAHVTLGDGTYIGPDVKIVGNGSVRFGDYCKIHAGTFINVPHSHSSIVFGHNCWFGERCVLDGTGGIDAGNNVGAGIGSQLYSHIAHGDVGAGCRLYGMGKLLLGDDVWFVGQCLVSPIVAERRSVAVLGSVVTKAMKENRIYGGSPARDITDKMGGPPWRDISPEQQVQQFETCLREFASRRDREPVATDMRACVEYPAAMDERVTYFNVVERTYTKRRSPKEIRFMQWLTSYKGRFTPVGA